MDDWTAGNIPSVISWLDAQSWKKGNPVGLTRLAGSSKAYFLSHWREKVRGPLLVVAPHLRDVDTLLEDLRFFMRGSDVPLLSLPPMGNPSL
jgi:hypothetical protein